MTGQSIKTGDTKAGDAKAGDAGGASPIEAVAFDLDGLMFNTETVYRELTRVVLRRRDRDCPDQLLDAMMGRPALEAFQIMIRWHDLTDSVAELSAECDGLFGDMLDDYLAPMPGLLDLLAFLEARQIPKVIATSSRRALALEVLQRFGMTDRFRDVLTVDRVPNGKPSPDLYQLSASVLDCSPGSMLVLEDSVVGCQAGVAAGAKVIAVPGEFNSHHDFSFVSHVVDSLAHPLIRQQFTGGRPSLES